MPAPQNVYTRPFRNKMIYLGFIIVLFFPIYWLSHPASGSPDQGSPGGFLENQLRTSTVDLKELGEINMAAETMRLGTFGMDGIVQMMLWLKADEYKKKKEWTQLAATLNQLIVMNPHLETVWRFQGWNLAYNVSVEQDNYHDRYFWVIKGIRFLKWGTDYNPRSIRVTWEVGWTITQKMGKSDEHVYFHEFYKNDPDVRDIVPAGKTTTHDGWLDGKMWYLRMVDLHDKEGVDLETITPALFYSYAPLAQAYYADNLEQLGNFDTSKGSSSSALSAWDTFNKEWIAFGKLDLESSFGEKMKLIEQEDKEKSAKKTREELEALEPGKYDRLVNDKKKLLSNDEKMALLIPMENRNADEQNLASAAEEKIRVTNEEWAQNLSMVNRAKGMELAKKLDNFENEAKLIKRYRNIVNYVYWNLRGELEKRPEIIEARKLVYEGDKLFENNELRQAVDNYDRAFKIWEDTITQNEQFRDILEEDLFASDLRLMYDKYELIRMQYEPDLRSEQVRTKIPAGLKKVLDTAPSDTGEVERMKMRHERNMKREGYVPGKFI